MAALNFPTEHTARVESQPKRERKALGWLHRALKIRPGYAPALLCSREHNFGPDLLVAFDLGLIVAALIAWHASPPTGIALLVSGLLCLVAVDLPFREHERLARERIRRGQCGACGSQLIGAHQHCAKCDA